MEFEVFNSLMGQGAASSLKVIFMGSAVAIVLARMGFIIVTEFGFLRDEKRSIEQFMITLLQLFLWLLFMIAFFKLLP